MGRTVVSKPAKSRQLKIAKYRSFRLSPKIKHSHAPLPSPWTLLITTLRDLKSQWRFFAGVAFIYGFLLLTFAGNFFTPSSQTTSQGVTSTVQVSNSVVGQEFFNTLIGSQSAGGAGSQGLIFVICSLALVWGLRQLHGRKADKLKIRDGFYKGMYPLVPVLAIGFLLMLELAPLAIAGNIYIYVIAGGLAVLTVEKVVWWLLIVLLFVLSLYWVSSSLIAVYISTLPDMPPMRALRAAKDLVIHRRFEILRRVAWLFIAMLIFAGLVLVPLVASLPRLAGVALFTSTCFALPLFHGYMYNLYRALIS